MAVKRRKRKKSEIIPQPLLLSVAAGLAILIASAFFIGRHYAGSGRGTAAAKPISPVSSGVLTDGARQLRAKGGPDSEWFDTGIVEVAIVIDDLGPNLAYARELMDLHPGFTLAIIPWEDASLEIHSEAMGRDIETILHQPMEPRIAASGRRLRGMLRLNMSDREIRRVLLENIRAYPGISGINNHMGSAFTENLHAMSVVAGVLKQENLVFMDSLTSPDTKGPQAAEMTDLDFYRRDIFLDNQADYDYMNGMWKMFLDKAGSRGRAVLIAHGKGESIEFLRARLTDLERLGLVLVPLSRMAPEILRADT